MCKDPFRVCFPIAILLAVHASLLWICFAFFEYGTYPGFTHARFFIGGFLYLSIIGFLTTAIPRFTSTAYATTTELTLIAVLIFAVLTTLFFDKVGDFWLTITFGWVFLTSFAIRRFLKRSQNPPFTFLFVGLGIVLGTIGSILQALYYANIATEPLFFNLGKVCFYDAMVLSLIIGVGGRLVPGILGFQEIVIAQRKIYEKPMPFLRVVPGIVFVLALLFVLSIWLEVSGFTHLGYIVRAVVITYVSIKFWSLHKKPPEWKWHGFFIRLSCLFLVVGSWLLIFPSNYMIAIKHINYIGGYSLLTLMIASRVTLAHGSKGLRLEKNFFPFTAIGIFIVLASVTRTSANLVPEYYIPLLGAAALFFCIGLIIWGIVFIPKALEIKSLPNKN